MRGRRQARPVRLQRAVLLLLVTVLPVLASAVPLVAQREPPTALTVEDPRLPDFELRSLISGAELIVVSDHEQPFVTLNLVFRGGTSADPERQAGVAALTAELLTAGVQGQVAGQVAEDLDALGALLGASAGPDYITVSLRTVTDQLEAALEIMADVVLRPQLPADRLAQLVSQAQNALALQSGSATFQASRAFTRELYGAHPYGKIQTAETLGRIDVQAVTRFHRSFFVPNNAVFVVAGDLDADDALHLLDRFFGDWEQGQVSLPTYFGLPERSERQIVLVHQPGSSRAIIRAGQTTLKGDDDDWITLRVANRILGEGASSRLQKGDGARPAPASTALLRRKDVGTFQARLDVPTAAVVSELEAVFAELERIRSTAPGPDELRVVQQYLTGAFPLSVETPQQIANQVTNYLLLGADRTALETYQSRVLAITPEQVSAAAAEHLQPDRLVVVVVGDAVRLHDALATLGPVRILDFNNAVLEVDQLLAPRPTTGYDASGLVPMAWHYDVLAQNFPAGEVHRRLTPGATPGTLLLESVGKIGPREVSRVVTFEIDTFTPVEAEDQLKVQGRVLTSRLSIEGSAVTGFARGPSGEQPIEGDFVPGALLGEMSEALLWLIDLDELDEMQVPVIGQNGRSGMVTLRSRGEREVRVPAGRFDTYEVELEGGGQRQRIFIRKEHPRFTVKIELVGQPVETVLTGIVEESPAR